MRKQIARAIALAFLLCAPAFAQRVEIYGGAQFEHLQPSYNAFGWTSGAVTGNFKNMFWELRLTSAVSTNHVRSVLLRFTRTQSVPSSPHVCQ